MLQFKLDTNARYNGAERQLYLWIDETGKREPYIERISKDGSQGMDCWGDFRGYTTDTKEFNVDGNYKPSYAGDNEVVRKLQKKDVEKAKMVLRMYDENTPVKDIEKTLEKIENDVQMEKVRWAS